MKDLKLIFENGLQMSVPLGTKVRDILKQIDDDEIIALRINGEPVNADYEITEDAYIKFINITDRVGQKIYIKGLQYVYITAIKELYGSKSIVNIKHSLDKGIYSEIEIKKPVTKTVVEEIKNKMKEICKKDIPFKSVSVSRDDAIDYVKDLNENEKVLNYKYSTNDSVTMYEFNDDYNYFYYIMPASSKILKRFDLTLVSTNGIIINYPVNNIVPKYNPAPKVLEAFKSYEKNLLAMGVKYSGDLNKIIIDGKINDFIQTNEIIYDQNMENIAYKVANNRNIKAIFISGPSSSGKTTTSKKLALYLKSLGISSLVLSTDDYFLERNQTPRKEDGSYEFEIVDAIDIKLFNSHLTKLLNNEEIIVHTYNFITGEKEYKNKPTRLKKGQVLIVEGLHAINDKISASIDKKKKLKIYISPFTPIGLDRHNHISTTDVRFLRRLVRDYKHRGYSAEATLNNWISMRSSEERYVYPYQREADVIINTSLAYEIGVLRPYAEPLLFSISKENENYEEALRILNFLKMFLTIPSESVPSVSVLREFIGDSYFE